MKILLNLILFVSYALPTLVSSQEFPLPQAISVIISQKGFDSIKDEIIPILGSNGVDLSKFKMNHLNYTSEIIPTEKLSQNIAMQKTIKEMSSLLERYLINFELKDHQFKVDVKQILLSAKWSKIQLIVHPFVAAASEQSNPQDLFFADLILVADNILIEADSITLEDTQNSWLGQWGVNKVSIGVLNKSMPLAMRIPLRFFRQPNDLLGIEVLPVATNLEKIKLSLNYAKPLIMPTIQIKINEQAFEVNKSEIQKEFKEQEPAILKSIQDAIDEHAKEAIPVLLNSYIGKFLDGGITEINQMAPPGAPDDQNVVPINWGIQLTRVATNTGLLGLQFSGMVNDPSKKSQPLSRVTQKIVPKPINPANESLSKYDMSFVFSAQFFNSFVEAGFNRGYYKKVELAGGDAISLTKSPIIYVDKNNVARMTLAFTQEVKGLTAIAVRNPVRIEMDLILTTTLNTTSNTVSLTISDIDMSSVKVEANNFIWPFKSTGITKAKQRIEEARSSIKGYILSSELPVPTDLMGITLEIMATSFDANGYLLFHANYR